MKCNGYAHVVWGDVEQFDSDIPDHVKMKGYDYMPELMTYASYLERRRRMYEEREKKMKVTLRNGMTLEGTAEQVTQAAKTLGYSLTSDGLHYLSSSRGLIAIRDMDSTHLRNAMLKMYREWVEGLRALHGRDLLNALRSGPDNITFKGLLAEYAVRVARGL